MHFRQARWTRLIVWAFALWVFWAGMAACAQEPEPAAPEAAPAADLWVFIKEIFGNLFNSRALMGKKRKKRCQDPFSLDKPQGG